MTEMMAFNWERVDAVVEQMEDELTQARSEFITLCRMVSEWIGHLKELIIDLDQGGRQRDEAIDDLGTWTEDRSIRVPTSACVDCDPDEWVEPFLEPIRMKEISALNEKDGPGWEDRQPKDSLLKRAQENLEELKQRAHRKFDSVLMSLTEAILFLIYINDFHNCSKELHFHLFADDANLFIKNKNINILVRK